MKVMNLCDGRLPAHRFDELLAYLDGAEDSPAHYPDAVHDLPVAAVEELEEGPDSGHKQGHDNDEKANAPQRVALAAKSTSPITKQAPPNASSVSTNLRICYYWNVEITVLHGSLRSGHHP